jgi:hypothetical protein
MPCCHSGCFKSAQDCLTRELLLAAEHWFDLSPSQARRREASLRQTMVGNLRQAFPDRHLPDELWLNIAARLVREFAASLLLQAASQVEMPKLEHLNQQHVTKPTVSLFQPVYATYVMFEGIRYIHNLRNATEAEAREGEHLLLAPESGQIIDRVYVGSDHFGIRLVRFASSGRVLPEAGFPPGLWWTCLTKENGIQWFQALSDVSANPCPLLPRARLTMKGRA